MLFYMYPPILAQTKPEDNGFDKFESALSWFDFTELSYSFSV